MSFKNSLLFLGEWMHWDIGGYRHESTQVEMWMLKVEQLPCKQEIWVRVPAVPQTFRAEGIGTPLESSYLEIQKLTVGVMSVDLD